MGAAEKLKALENFGPPENYDAMHHLQDVFPQIVAVVEAAEEHLDVCSRAAGVNVPLRDALSALGEALGDDELRNEGIHDAMDANQWD